MYTGAGATFRCRVVCFIAVDPRQQDAASPTPQHPLCRAHRHVSPAAETFSGDAARLYSSNTGTESQGRRPRARSI